jgi:hypothetical protein
MLMSLHLPTIGCLLLLAAGCGGGGGATSTIPPGPSVPFLATTPKHSFVYAMAFTQLTSASPKRIGQAAAAVESALAGLPEIRRVAPHPIVAMTEDRGWFIYATSTGGEVTNPTVSFISGYAIRKGSKDIIEWSVW